MHGQLVLPRFFNSSPCPSTIEDSAALSLECCRDAYESPEAERAAAIADVHNKTHYSSVRTRLFRCAHLGGALVNRDETSIGFCAGVPRVGVIEHPPAICQPWVVEQILRHMGIDERVSVLLAFLVLLGVGNFVLRLCGSRAGRRYMASPRGKQVRFAEDTPRSSGRGARQACQQSDRQQLRTPASVTRAEGNMGDEASNGQAVGGHAPKPTTIVSDTDRHDTEPGAEADTSAHEATGSGDGIAMDCPPVHAMQQVESEQVYEDADHEQGPSAYANYISPNATGDVTFFVSDVNDEGINHFDDAPSASWLFEKEEEEEGVQA
jgi:hypothetical protein